MKTVLFLPGFPDTLESRDYQATMSAIKDKGFKVVFVPIHWTRTTIVDWTKELDEVYAKYNPADTILAGFSYGAMTAFMSATKRNPSELWLFSLSPYFSEDLKSRYMRPTWLNGIGHRRVTEFRKLDFKELAKDVTCKTLLFAGKLEIDKWPIIGERVTKAHAQLPDTRLTIVENAGHDVTNVDYIQSIVESIDLPSAADLTKMNKTLYNRPTDKDISDALKSYREAIAILDSIN